MKIQPIFLSVLLITAGCQSSGTRDQIAFPELKSEVVAKVNGQPITRAELENLKKRFPFPVPEEKLLDQLVRQEILKQEALKRKLHQQEEVAAELHNVVRAVLSRAEIEDYLERAQISEERTRAEYDRLVQQMAGEEYKARHILVKTKEEAEKIIEELEKGADFAGLAKKYSIGPSGKRGGDLGWFTADRMVKPFAGAVKKLQDGAFTKEPVKTQFGWHVILREASREKQPPSYERVKPQIEQQLKQKLIQQYVEDLYKKAKVEVLLKQETPKAQPEQPLAPHRPKQETEEKPASQSKSETRAPEPKAQPGG